MLVLSKVHPRVARGELLLAKGYPGSAGLAKVGTFLDAHGEEQIPVVGYLTSSLCTI